MTLVVFSHPAAKLTYLEATVMEVNRMSVMVPIPARRTLTETTINGYTIPNNITILPNLYSLHYNPEFFPDPFKFDPTRFLDEAGQLKKPPPEGYMPFASGNTLHGIIPSI